MTDTAGAEPAAALPRTAFTEAVEACLAARQEDGRGMAVLLVDCGLIGRIDAIWGYAVGDAVRQRYADSLIADVLRPGDQIGLMGRDELACLLATVDDPYVPLLAAEKILRALTAPLWMGEEEIYSHPAIGIASVPEDGSDAATLLQRARSASLQALQTRERISGCNEAGLKALESSLMIESRLRAAVQEDSFELYYQPQYDLRLGPIMAVQVHLAWRDPAAGLVVATQAYAAAESAGTSVTLLSSILNRSLRNVSEFRYSAGLDLLLGVPLPAFVLRNPDLPEVVERALGTWRLRAGRIVFQVSDTAILETDAACRDNLLRLKRLGVRLCLDDPGASLSSLAFLATLPFQEIRLDLSRMVSVAEAAEAAAPAAVAPATARPNTPPPPPPKSERIPAAFISLAHQLSLEVVACGVPNEAASASLKELGCEYIQADFMGPALDADAFVSRFG